MDNITCYLSGVQDQTWQPMNSLLMDGQEERQKKKVFHCRAILVLWCFFSPAPGMCSVSVDQHESEPCGTQ